MSKIEEWIRFHHEELAEIAATADLESAVLHLVAVKVLAGFEDDQISGSTPQPDAFTRWPAPSLGRSNSSPGRRSIVSPRAAHETPGSWASMKVHRERDGDWDLGPWCFAIVRSKLGLAC